MKAVCDVRRGRLCYQPHKQEFTKGRNIRLIMPFWTETEMETPWGPVNKGINTFNQCMCKHLLKLSEGVLGKR